MSDFQPTIVCIPTFVSLETPITSCSHDPVFYMIYRLSMDAGLCILGLNDLQQFAICCIEEFSTEFKPDEVHRLEYMLKWVADPQQRCRDRVL